MSPIDLNVDFDLIRHDFLKGFVCTKLHRAKYDEHVEYTACLTCNKKFELDNIIFHSENQ